MKKRDYLERLISDNKEALNNDEPHADLWNKISHELGEEPTKSVFSKSQIYWKVAAILLLGICSFLLVERFSQKSDFPQKQVAVVDRSGEEVDAEFARVERFYAGLIEEKKMLLASYEKDNGLREEFTQDIEKLDNLYLKLKDELAENKNNDKLIEVMIRNLQFRIEILNQQLMILEKVQQVKTQEDDETTTI